MVCYTIKGHRGMVSHKSTKVWMYSRNDQKFSQLKQGTMNDLFMNNERWTMNDEQRTMVCNNKQWTMGFTTSDLDNGMGVI